MLIVSRRDALGLEATRLWVFQGPGVLIEVEARIHLCTQKPKSGHASQLPRLPSKKTKPLPSPLATETITINPKVLNPKSPKILKP